MRANPRWTLYSRPDNAYGRPALKLLLCTMALFLVILGAQSGVRAQQELQGNAFFEQNIRPLLVQRCYGCHSTQAKTPQGGLLLDSRAGWQKGANNGTVIVPGDAANSRLIQAVQHRPGISAMPPDGKLSDREIVLLVAWVQRGAPDPRDGRSGTGIKKSDHWAFRPIRRVVPPIVKNVGWCKTPIDRFVLAKLEACGLTPALPADRCTLLRRVTFDLTGLPPTPEELDRFLKDRSPNAYARLVDRLLASPAYGERWGRHWLDVAHYGDTHGYDKDKRRDNAWPYRDYVIRSFNQDKPYSRFLREQVAGDALFPETQDGIVATGFLVAGPWDFVGQVELEENTVEKEKTRNLDRDDIVSTVVSTFNSVTIHCARCHDHKFDPIPQRDYYRLQAVFAGIERGDRLYADGQDTVSQGSPTNGWHSDIVQSPDVEKWVQIDLGHVAPLDRLRLLPAYPTDFADTPGFGFPRRFRVQISDTPDFRQAVTAIDRTTADFPNPGNHPVELALGGTRGRYVRITATRLWERTHDFVFALAEGQVFAGKQNLARGAKVTALDSIEAGRWSVRFLTDGFDSRYAYGRMVYAAVPRMARPIHLLARGEVEQPRDEMTPGALSCLAGMPANFTLQHAENEGERRAAFANWLASPQNTLTWRSIVNRIWQWHFGRGIVDTPNDFGRNGSLPSHLELLDWLAARFRDGGQSIKALNRLILLSSVYQQSSKSNPSAEKRDGDNRLLWHMNRRRLEAEEIRDATLAISGTLDRKMGGPGYEPFRFKDDHSPIYDHTAIEAQLNPKNWRRTVYRFAVRSVPDPFLDALDVADPNIHVAVRNSTLTALQSLVLWNNPLMLRQAECFAESLQHSVASPGKQIDLAFCRAFARLPSRSERADALVFLRRSGLVNFCRVLFNANEFIFVD